MLITFSGLDGAGKSTLIEYLKQNLQQRNRRVAVFHMYRDVGLFACTSFVAAKLIGNGGRKPNGKSPCESPELSRGAGPGKLPSIVSAVIWNRRLRLFIYPLDLLIFLTCRLYIEKVMRQVLIMDRYFYDTLADVADGPECYGVRLLKWFTPTPHVPVYLDIIPEEAYARKGEHSLDHLRRRRMVYQKLFTAEAGALILSSNGDLKATRETLERVVLGRMYPR